MAEKSIFWTTGSTGDGAAAYSMAEVINWVRRTFGEGVHPRYANALNATVAAPNVNIGTGAAVVYGFPYLSDAVVAVNIPTPGGATRIDRIVLRADWTAQTVRITRLAGTEGSGQPPDITQNYGSIWDLKLYQVQITTGGAITILADEREYCKYYTNLADGIVGTSQLADGAVNEARLGAGAVTAGKIASGAVTNVKLAADAVATANIQNGAVTPAKIAGYAPGGFIWTVGGSLSIATDVGMHYSPNGPLTHVEAELLCKTAPTGQAIIVDINRNGTSIFSPANRPQIAAGQTKGESVTFSVAEGADDDIYTVDIDQVGSGTAGADLTIILHFKRALVG